ncbi:hypothetical protein GLIP_0551 [Aliiglaciecola lipolytica E3]|uniref:Uncharacterized protein n=1 Tax=Aliiglaciecola lipolytica E3 TaxID=1127673 RepID=K6Y4L7_9ALTE|nr:hypothetical protein GLIP_0551 [Aliiglaciecola lipolytica E3]
MQKIVRNTLFYMNNNLDGVHFAGLFRECLKDKKQATNEINMHKRS